MINKKETLEKILSENEEQLFRLEVSERYFLRKRLVGKSGQIDQVLAKVQNDIMAVRDFVGFLEEILKEEGVAK